MGFETTDLKDALTESATVTCPQYFLKEALAYGETESRDAAAFVLRNEGDPAARRLMRDILRYF